MKDFEKISEDIYIKGENYILYDKYWQEPAITELAAHRSISKFDISSSNNIYLAFPWATLIDLTNRKITHNTKKFKDILKALVFIKNLISNYEEDEFCKIITCCQHIHALDHLNYFKDCKVTDLFWSHKVKFLNNIQSIKLHPFPLSKQEMKWI